PAPRVRRRDQPRGGRRRRHPAGGNRHRRDHPAAGPGRHGRLSRATSLAMFACAIRGGPVALVESDERGAQRHWSEAALGIAGVDIDTPVELPLGDGDADHADEAAEHELLRARVLRGLAWRRAGTAAFDVEAFLGRSPEPARMRRLLAACEAIRVRPVIARMYPG